MAARARANLSRRVRTRSSLWCSRYKRHRAAAHRRSSALQHAQHFHSPAGGRWTSPCSSRDSTQAPMPPARRWLAGRKRCGRPRCPSPTATFRSRTCFAPGRPCSPNLLRGGRRCAAHRAAALSAKRLQWDVSNPWLWIDDIGDTLSLLAASLRLVEWHVRQWKGDAQAAGPRACHSPPRPQSTVPEPGPCGS